MQTKYYSLGAWCEIVVKKSGDVFWRSARDERKGTPIFWRHPGSSRHHQGYMAQRTHWTCFSRVGRRHNAKMAQLGSSSLSHQHLPLEDGVMGLLPKHTPNLTAKKTHFFPGSSLQTLENMAVCSLVPEKTCACFC